MSEIFPGRRCLNSHEWAFMPADSPALRSAEPFGAADTPVVLGSDGQPLGAIRPLVPKSSLRWRSWLAGCVSIALLVGCLWQLRRAGLGEIEGMFDRSPAFWLTFLLLYVLQPVSDQVIFRRLWGLPLSGLSALLRKYVSNEIIFGYSGEVYFYLWARDRIRLANAPFRAIKDVSITSALTGNLVTLAMMGLAIPALRQGDLGAYSMPILWSGLAVVGLSLAILLFSRKIFSLPRRELFFVSGVHLCRLVTATGLTALLWHLALPGVGLGLWVVLSALRLLIGRLPFVTNKDLVFANVAIFLIGRQTEISDLMAAVAVLTLATHLVVVIALGVGDLVKAARRG